MCSTSTLLRPCISPMCVCVCMYAFYLMWAQTYACSSVQVSFNWCLFGACTVVQFITKVINWHMHSVAKVSFAFFLPRKQTSVQSIDCESSAEVNALWHSLQYTVWSATLKAQYGVRGSMWSWCSLWTPVCGWVVLVSAVLRHKLPALLTDGWGSTKKKSWILLSIFLGLFLEHFFSSFVVFCLISSSSLLQCVVEYVKYVIIFSLLCAVLPYLNALNNSPKNFKTYLFGEIFIDTQRTAWIECES